MSWLEYLTQVLPDTPALPPSTLMVRADLSDADSEDVAAELERAGLVTRTTAGLAPTGKQWDGPGYISATAMFAYDLDDTTEIHLPPGWTPAWNALASSARV